MSPKRTGMHFLFCFVDLALIAPNIRWIRRFSAAAQHLIMVHFNLSPLQERLSFECVNTSVEILFPRHEQAGRKMRMRRGIREVLRLQAYTDIRCGSEIAGGI